MTDLFTCGQVAVQHFYLIKLRVKTRPDQCLLLALAEI